MSFEVTVQRFRESARTRAVVGTRSVYGRPETISALARAGADYIYLDQQHGVVNSEAISTAAAIANDHGVAILVRVIDQSPASIGKALDAGAHGIIVPDVEDVEQARKVVAAFRYPPEGTRSWGMFSLGGEGYSPSSVPSVRPLCFPMIESPSGVANASSVAHLEGVDGLYVGRFDLALMMNTALGDFGVSGPHSDAIKSIRRACDDANVLLGTSGDRVDLTEQGYRMQTVGSELDLLVSGFKLRLGSGADRS